MSDDVRDEMTLMAAAHALGISYERARRRLLTGQLKGRQDEDGRWVVARTSVEQTRRERTELVAQPA